jgi:subtilisin family serine protease
VRILIEFRAAGAEEIEQARRGVDAGLTMDAEVRFTIDPDFEPVQIPAPLRAGAGAARLALEQPLEFSFEPETSTYVTRATIHDENAEETAFEIVRTQENIVGVYSDPVIEPILTCGTTPPVGDAGRVADLLSATKLKAAGLGGSGVHVAIVDSGINLDFLRGHGRNPSLDEDVSWVPAGVDTAPGEHPVAHGTMCAWDVGIVAPEATLVDLAILRRPSKLGVTLSDAVLAYDKLRRFLTAQSDPAPQLVVTNSWGVFDPSSDFPVGSPSNYTDNQRHPFSLQVAGLESLGADILFAAGNCGPECPDGRCHFSSLPITGANSHPKVLCIAGIDVNDERVGYSSQGPGRLTAQKPDVCTYTHFLGSRVNAGVPPNSAKAADTGTSAACPVAAGVVAAIRERYPSSVLSPQGLRDVITKTARDLGVAGFDYDYGWGALDPSAVLAALPPP